MSDVVIVQLDSVVVQTVNDVGNPVTVFPGDSPRVDVIVAGTQGPPGSFWLPEEISFIHMVTNADMLSKSFKLPSSPVSNLYIQHLEGAPLIVNRDFILIKDVISWDSHGLDGTVQSGDEIFVRYFI